MDKSTSKTVGGACSKATRNYPDGRTGTYSGYDAHIKSGEQACGPCAQARREYSQARRDSLKGKARENHLEKARQASTRYREAHPERVKESGRRRLKERQEAMRALKESSPCTDCGEFYPFCVMEFDHVEGVKVSKLATWAVNNGRQRVLEEIEKCELVCSNCHMERTYSRMGEERAYARPRSLRNRDIMRLTKSQPCADCGISYEPHIMEFDHVRGEKKFNIGALGRNVKTDELIAEMNKCDVVCGNCHAQRTYSRIIGKEVSK